MSDLQLKTTKFELGVIETNLTELEKIVDESLEKYRGLVVTEDAIGEAKKTRSDLNALKKTANDWRIRKEKEFNEPFAQVKAQVKRICDNIDNVNGEIDKQIKTFEEAQKEEKRASIEAWWSENGKRTVPLEKVWDERYLNKTFTDKQWQQDLRIKCQKITNDLSNITQMGSPEKVDFLITNYMQTLDVSASLAAWERQEEAKRRAEEEKARMEAERLAREERARQQAETKPQSTPEPEAPKPETDDPNDYLYSPTFKMIDLTFTQAMDLTNYMKSHGLRFESIAKEKRRK